MISLVYANMYCCDDVSKIENYELAIADNSQIWDIHHRLEIHEDYLNTREDLKLMNLYWDRPANELIFLTHSEHIAMHCKKRTGERSPLYGKTGELNGMYGRSGDKHPMYGKGYLISGEKNARYGKFGEQSPCWKAESKNIMTIYNRAYKSWKKGEMTESEFQNYRVLRREYMQHRVRKRRPRKKK